ncbi:MAG: PucR family transcriptional regulator [Sciscionella sp.]
MGADPVGEPLAVTRPRGWRVGSVTDGQCCPAAASVLQSIATQLDGQAENIAKVMTEVYQAEIPAYRAIRDGAIHADVHGVSSALVRCWLHVMANGEGLEYELLAQLSDGARRRAVQGIPLQSMLRAYRIGIRVMWGEITSAPVWQQETLQGAVVHVATWVLDFADWICTAVATAYQDEASRLAKERELRRSSLLNVILAGPVAGPAEGPADLERPHCIVVAKVTAEALFGQLEQAGHLLEEAAGAVLWTIRHRSVAAALEVVEPHSREQLRRTLAELVGQHGIVALGLGGRASKPVETRQSYIEAVEALRIGPAVRSRANGIYDFQDTASLVAMLANPEHARRFADTTLEPIAGLAPRWWVLPTIEAYLDRQGHLKEAAADLNVHVNTLKYRMKVLRSAADVGLDGQLAATLLLALRVHRLLDGNSPDTAARPAAVHRAARQGLVARTACAPPARNVRR